MIIKQSTLAMVRDPDLGAFIKAVAINTSRTLVRALTIVAITDNSTGTAAGTLDAVPTQDVKTAQSGSNLASRPAFNTAIGKINDATATLAAYLVANGWTALGLPTPTGYPGTVTAGTVAACDKSVAGVDGTGGNAMLRSEFNSAVVRMRNNQASVLRMYNTLSMALGDPTVPNSTSGSPGVAYNALAAVTAPTAVAAGAVASSDLAAKTYADEALVELVDNVASLAAKINTILLATGVTGTPVPILLVP